MNKTNFTEKDVKDMVAKKFYIQCPFCEDKITGTKKSQVVYNMKIHIISKHEEVNQ